MTWLWGGFSVDNPTLNRFFSLHYLLPFVIFAVVFLHILALHQFGSNNPVGIDLTKKDKIPFHPYYTIKDIVRPVGVPDHLRVLRLLRAELAGRSRTTTSRPTR